MQKSRRMYLQLAAVVLASIMCITALLGGFSLPAIAVELTGHGVTGLTADYTSTPQDSSRGSDSWAVESGKLTWTGTTGSSGWLIKNYYYRETTLTLENNSNKTQVLTFNYSATLNGGTVTIDGVEPVANFSKTLNHGDSVTIVAKSSTTAANTTTVTLSGIKLDVQEVTVTFAPATNGSYTVDGTKITAATSKTAASTATYKLVATPATNYVFAGWYLGETLLSKEQTWATAGFSSSGTATAKFVLDPLYTQATVPADSAYTKAQLVSIYTRYYHNSKSDLVADGNRPSNDSYYSKLAASQTKDKIDVQYVPSLQWSDSMSVSYSASARGDYVTRVDEESYAYAQMLTDVIRIYANENCNISFDYTNSMSAPDSFLSGVIGTERTNTVYLYITTASNATLSQVKSGAQTQLTETSGSTGTIALSKGNYLYIVMQSYAKNRYLSNAGTMGFDYNASISNFQVSYNEKKDTLNVGFRDNTGVSLGSGQINVNGVNYAIGTDGNMAAKEFADLASVTLKVGTAPANYTHIGWAVTPEGGTTTYQYTATYTRTLTENVSVVALFAPKMTITMGSSGYSNATYTLPDGSAANGQYVARNTSSTAFYTSLASAFSSTDVVVLLAGDTFKGNWEIPSGKTLVIPYGLDDVGSTTPISTTSGRGANYCFATLGSGNLTVNGTLLVSAQQYCGSGTPGGPLGHLSLASGATITVNGSLYAYGPITGAGTITANSTAKIHEYVEFQDNRPVMFVYNIYEGRGDYEVFPFNGMFINTIEAAVTYQGGATLTGHAALKYDTVSTAPVPVLGTSGAMLNYSSTGSVTKYYDAATGQFVFRVNENTEAYTDSFSITMTVTVAGTTMDITINSAEYYIPFASAWRFEVLGEMTFDGNYKFLPGAKLDVMEGGEVIVPSGSNLIFYRYNDYDYRGKNPCQQVNTGETDDSGNAITELVTDPWGYSERAYPMTPCRFPGVSYPFTFNSSNIGSAKLNVDGTLTVNGGVYVTDMLVEILDTHYTKKFVRQDNGYNYLTGTGTINMSNAQTDLGVIHEVKTASNTNDLSWVDVTVVPIKGLKADATADDAEQYVSLSDGIFCGVIKSNGLNIWCAHNYTGVVTEPTCTENGYTTYTCSGCGDTYTEVIPAGHTYQEGSVKCTVCGLFEFCASNVRLGNNLDMMFAFPMAGLPDDPQGYSVQIVRTMADGTTTTETIPYTASTWRSTTVNGVACYYVTYSGFAAKEMCDTVTLTVFRTANGENVTVSAVWVDSIQNYAMRMLSKHSENTYLRTLLVDMLNYGTACQKHFATAEQPVTDTDLANTLLNATQQGYATQSTPEASDDYATDRTSTSKGYWAGSNVMADSNTQFVIGFNNLTDGMYITYSFTNHWNKPVERRITYNEMTSVGAYHGLANLRIADARQAITITVYGSDGTQLGTWQDSIEAYVYRMQDKGDVYMALLKFADSAKAYLHSEEVVT